ncbi:MAG: bifunctional phosphopantothenoylcysteine decarboxylase/phosphopantothenate--cysteine ligase CoaBC [Chitinispirillales bacterium]|jgi:phosphopantothenoylcysteine decarboxylase/phosphopantothenate--cysteine ligase|nr:bifunctional phosphopantothenoylcysteine decarboxylase/phosphopantothenate--cysteine ligase CoaBC [Chitinispirillales bacterium]
MSSVRRVLIGITGGIAAYKIPLLVRLLRKNGCEVKAALTNAAKTLVGVDALRTLTGNPVYMDGEYQYDMDHIRLSEWADVFVICPATANTIAKMSAGIADNLLTTLALSVPEKKIIVAPAMNREMWANKATQSNIGILKHRGIDVLPVGEGELACGVSGPGRMVEIEEIARRILSMPVDSGKSSDNQASGAIPHILNGKKILISSGPTEEPIDPVRVITNRSSGKMGAALAKAALRYGADVTVVTGPATEPLPPGVDIVSVKTAAEMQREMSKRFDDADICIMAAAVSDYRPLKFSETKLRKSSEQKNITLELIPNPDILAKLGAAKTKQFLVGFSLESDDEIERARAKMKKKKCDMMIFNKVDKTLGKDHTGFSIILNNAKTPLHYPSMNKIEAAAVMLDVICGIRGD